MATGSRPRSDVRIRDVEDADLDLFFAFQSDPRSARMAEVPIRDRDAFTAHWARVRADPSTVTQAVLVGETVVGDVSSWTDSGRRSIGYRIDRAHWSGGVATAALTQFLDRVRARPLYAEAVVHNIGSIRVLEKCGFRRIAPPAASPGDGIEEVHFVLDSDPRDQGFGPAVDR